MMVYFLLLILVFNPIFEKQCSFKGAFEDPCSVAEVMAGFEASWSCEELAKKLCDDLAAWQVDPSAMPPHTDPSVRKQHSLIDLRL